MKDNTNNKEFWNNYVSYWENKVEEANKDSGAADKTVDDVLLEKFFGRLEVGPEDKLLDYGCGFGRLYPVYRQKVGEERAGNYCGIDVSGVSLEHAGKRYPELLQGKNLVEFDGEKIPFQAQYFDKIMCFSVFDAVKQEIVLAELLRVMKPGGKLLITGKNIRYFEDDEEAMIAEINARKKNHPNSFTDAAEMKRQLERYGIEVCEEYYFLKRCDFALNRYVCSQPDTFYQWAFVLKKVQERENFIFQNFCSHYSETFKRIQKKSLGGVKR